MTHHKPLMIDNLGLLAQPGTPVIARIAVHFAVVMTKWATRRRTRLALTRLELWQLRDVGLTPEQAETEASRLFWQA